MEYRIFTDSIRRQIEKELGGGFETSVYPVLKNNSVRLDSLMIRCGDSNVTPAIYLNDYYRRMLAGESVETLAQEVLGLYEHIRPQQAFDMTFFSDWDQVSGRIVQRLICTDTNSELLGQVPHTDFLNLSIVYYYQMERLETGSAAVMVRNEHLDIWEKELPELHQRAKDNMRRLLPCDFRSMHEVMREMLSADQDVPGDEEAPLYVLSNKEKMFGAVWMTDPEVTRRIGCRLRGNYYILPSSVHECMIVPYGAAPEADQLLKMVTEINHTQVEPEEVLADALYLYDREKDKVEQLQQQSRQ